MDETSCCALLDVPQMVLKGFFLPEPDDPRLILEANDQVVAMLPEALLECLFVLEREGDIPSLPKDWWVLVASRYNIRKADIVNSLPTDMGTQD